jgi:hypothetical protein
MADETELSPERQAALMKRIKSMLDRAAHPNTPGPEADTALAMATEMMARYGLDAALLAATRPETDKMIDFTEQCPTPFAEAKYNMIFQIASAMRVRAIVNQGPGIKGKTRNTWSVTMLGWASDIERVKTMYATCLLQAFSRMQHIPIPYGKQKAAFRDSWLEGFALGVYRQIVDAEAKVMNESSGSGAELVVIDRNKAVDDEFNRRYPKTHSLKRNLSGGARTAGFHAGLEADLGLRGGVGSGSRTSIR